MHSRKAKYMRPNNSDSFGLPRWCGEDVNMPANAEDVGLTPGPERAHMLWSN